MKRWILGAALLAACNSASTPPVEQAGTIALAITSPAPGDELLAADHPTIAVTGTASTTNPDFGVLSVFVDGQAVALDDAGNFTAEVTPELGINHLAVSATDGAGTVVAKALDVAWAPAYLPPDAGTTGFTIADALDLDLGQRFFDARQLGTTLDRSTDPTVAHDLASALELILWNIDLASLIGGGLHLGTGSSTLDLTIPSARPGEIVVDATIADTPETAIDLSIDLSSVFLATTGTFHYSTKTLVVEGGLAADMHAQAHMAIAMKPDGTIGVTASSVTATIGPLVPMFTGSDGETLNGFINVGNNDFRTIVENLIQQQLIPTFTDKIPPLLETLLGATDQLLNDVHFTLDAQLGQPVTLTLNGKVGGLDVVAGPATGSAPGHVNVRQGVAVTTDAAAPIHASSRGALRVAAAPMVPAAGTAALEVVLAEDFLNGLLHALWNSGLLEGSAAVGGLNAGVSAKLAPIAIPTPDDYACAIDGVRCDLVVELGEIELTLPDTNQSFGLSARAGARVVVDGPTVSLAIAMVPDITVWEISDVAPSEIFTAQAVHDLVQTVVWPQLFGAIGSNLHITLPIPDLAALGLDQLSPTLATAKLNLAVRNHATVQQGYLGLGADLELTTPQPAAH